MLTAEQISQLASAVQSVAVAVAIVVGGVWPLFTFRRLGVAKKAEAELAEFQQKLNRTAQLNIDVAVRFEVLPALGQYLILATATIENVGSRRTNLQFPSDQRPFHAVRVSAELNGDFILGKWLAVGIPYGDGSSAFSKRAVVGPGARGDASGGVSRR